jgi:uncharacterized membrane protein YcaP (DUF421 family)
MFEMPVLEIFFRGTVAYFAIVLAIRFIPKRQTGDMSPNDVVALVIVGSLAADAIVGNTSALADILLMIIVVLFWDYIFNFLEYRFPRVRKVSQHSPTLLIYDGQLLKDNLKHEQLTEGELHANIRKHGIADVSQVKQAILETDGHISVIRMDNQN